MVVLQSALIYGQPKKQADGTYLFQKNFGRNSVIQYVPYDEWVKSLPAYEYYRKNEAWNPGGIPEPAGTDVWKDVILPKVAGMAISKGVGLGASSSVPSKVVSGSRGGGGGSLSTGETMEEAGLDALTHSLIEKLMGGRGVSQGYTDLPSSASIASQAKAIADTARAKAIVDAKAKAIADAKAIAYTYAYTYTYTHTDCYGGVCAHTDCCTNHSKNR